MIGVTGSTGFIGQHVVHELKERGLDYVCYKRGQDVGEFVKGCSSIIHCAGVTRGSFDEMVDCNFYLTYKLNELKDKETFLLYTSSIFAENNSIYGRTKLLGESVADCSIRLPNIYGPGSRPNYVSVVATWLYNMDNGIPCTLHNPYSLIGLLYVKDLVKLLVTTAVKKDSTGVYYVPPTSVVTLNDLFSLCAEVVGNTYRLGVVGDPVWEGIPQFFNSAHKEMLIEKPTPLYDGLASQYREMRDRL